LPVSLDAQIPADDRLVQVAYADDPLEAEMIRGLLESGGIPSVAGPRGIDGPMFGYGSLRPGFDGGSRQVWVKEERAEEAGVLLAKTVAENEGNEVPEIANATSLDEAGGHKPRNYGLAGGYARIYILSLGAMAVAFGVFLLLRAL
jgi:Putative prokaryotic signal transducing protein